MSEEDHLTKEDLYNGPGPESLPEELQKAKKDDTCCKVCGVSYLVFSEIKSLQRRTEEAENQMWEWKEKIDAYSSLEKKYNELLQQLKQKDVRLDDLQDKLNASEDRSDKERKEIEKHWEGKLEKELSTLRTTKREELAEKEAEHTKQLDAIRQERDQAVWEAKAEGKEEIRKAIRSSGVSMLQNVRSLKPSLKALASELNEWTAAFGTSVRTCNRHLKDVRDKQENQMDELTQKVVEYKSSRKKLEAELDSVRRSEQCFKQECANHKEEIKRLEEALTAQKNHQTSHEQSLKDQVLLKQREFDQTLQSREAEFEEERRIYASRVDAAESSQRKLQTKLEEVMADLETVRDQKRRQQQEHQQRLSALENDSTSRYASAEATWKEREAELESEINKLKRTLKEEEAQGFDYRRTCEEYQQLVQTVRNDLETTIKSEEEWRNRAEHAVAENNKAQEQLNEATIRAKNAEAARARSEKLLKETEEARDREKARADHAVKEAEEAIKSASSTEGLDGLEKHLIQLSEILKQKEAEIRHLESTVHQECMERTVILDQLNALRASASLPPMHLDDIRKAAHDPSYGEALANTAARQMEAITGGGGGSGGRVPVPGAGPVPRAAGTGSAAIRALRPASGSSSGSNGTSGSTSKARGPAWAPPSAVRGGSGRGRGRGKWR